ncbi:DUF2909 family protein [Flocculibacter collagenilyticus]|uniref:DUF2909 family protein n=1 Tax=Flocculibacter collagenilyticus TaxID=2744479 RepID=UPI0018F5875D|nr:DUF2909 family protein [Flocculibacter collagenilyticus]
MILKTILVLLLLLILFNLFRALFIMLKSGPNQPNMSKFLGRRVLFSVLVIVVLLLAVATGVITPNPRPY